MVHTTGIRSDLMCENPLRSFFGKVAAKKEPKKRRYAGALPQVPGRFFKKSDAKIFVRGYLYGGGRRKSLHKSPIQKAEALLKLLLFVYSLSYEPIKYCSAL